MRTALRVWRRTPTVALAAGTSLALGMAAVTVIFSVASATLLRPIPGTHRPGLVRVHGDAPRAPVLVTSYPEVEALRGSGLFASLVAERSNTLTVSVNGEARTVGGAAVSRDFFDALGVRMARGAGFASAGERADATPSAVVSHAFWTSVLARDPGVLGRPLRAGGLDFTIVGVADEGFSGSFPGFRTSVWVPLDYVESVFPVDGSLARMDDRFLDALGTLAEGQTLEQADARLAQVADRLRADPAFGEGRTFRVTSAAGVHPSLRGIARVMLTGMFAIVSAVLLLACANVANLLLARATSRTAEMASRLALGARRSQLVRQLLVESVVLGLAGAAAGVAVSAWIVRLLSSARLPLDVPVGLDLTLDARTLAFAGLVGVASGVVFGVAPALRASRRDLSRHLRGRPRNSWAPRVLIAFQLAVTSVLLFGAGLMVRSVGAMTEIEPGFARGRIVTVEADLTDRDEVAGRAFWRDARRAAAAVPGVDSAALGLFVHLGGRADQRRIAATSAQGEPWPLGAVNYSIVEGALFSVLDVDLTSGRAFDPTASARDGREVVVNAVLAGRLWPEGDPVGRTVRIEGPDGGVDVAVVVGVTETIKTRRLNEPPTPFFYLPYTQDYRADMVLHVRTTGDPASVLDELRARLRVLDEDVVVTVRRMEDHATVEAVLTRVIRTLLVASGVAALLIATVGVFGVVSYATELRVREIAIRMALGASVGRVQGMVVTQSLGVVALGSGVGLSMAYLASGVLTPFLYGVSPNDVRTGLAVAVAVVGVSLVACYAPARRVTAALELTAALRAE